MVEGNAFEALMSGSGDPDLYVRFGTPHLYVRFGAPPTTSSYDCRPNLYGATETCSLSVPAGGDKASVMVRGYTSGTYQVDLIYCTFP